MRINQPKTRDRSSAEASGLPVNPRTKVGRLYIYIHYEQGWYWTDKEDADGNRYGWLPRPQQALAVPGVNGVQDPGGRRPVRKEHMSGLLSGLITKGAKILDPEDARLGDYQYYDRYYDTQDGGRWYIEPGQEATVLANGSILWNADDVIETTLAFHAYLRDNSSAVLHPLKREVWQGMMAREGERLSRYEQSAGVTPGLGYRVERQRKKIALMNEDYKKYEASLSAVSVAAPLRASRDAEPLPATEAPKPKTRRGKTTIKPQRET